MGRALAVSDSLPVREDFSVGLDISLVPFRGICRGGGFAGMENSTSPGTRYLDAVSGACQVGVVSVENPAEGGDCKNELVRQKAQSAEKIAQ